MEIANTGVQLFIKKNKTYVFRRSGPVNISIIEKHYFFQEDQKPDNETLYTGKDTIYYARRFALYQALSYHQ